MSHYGSQLSTSSRGVQCISCRVLMLDDTELAFEIPTKSFGVALFESAVRKIQLLESDYFGLQYFDSESVSCWLDHEKPIVKQVKDFNFKFAVKFYTPDPELLEEEFTRYLFALQIKRDLADGTLQCQEHTAVLLASFIVQAEIGNYCDELADQDYLSNLKLLPNQTADVELRIMTHHKELVDQSPLEAEFNLLETVRKVEMYGVRNIPAKDHEGVCLQLSVSHAGVLVFQHFTRINLFSWAKIRKLCFKRKKFILKLHPDGSAYSKGTVEFYLQSRNWAKNFWKQCIEHHSFFRLHSSRHQLKRRPSRALLASHGSSFRYTGRTQKELVEYVRDNFVASRPFERSASMRTISMLSSRASTPRYGTLNSHRDLHPSSASLATSGSRTLDRPRPTTLERGTARSRHSGSLTANQAAVNERKPSDTDMNGSNGDNARIGPGFSQMSFQTFQGRVLNRLASTEQEPGLNNNVVSHGYLDMNAGRGNTLPVRSEKIDPSRFMLPPNNLGRPSPQVTSSKPPIYCSQAHSYSRQNSQPPSSQPSSYYAYGQSNGSLVRDAPKITDAPAIPVGRFPRQDHVDMTAGEDLPLPPPPMSLMTGGSLSRFAQAREYPSQSLGNLRSLSNAGLSLAPVGSVSGILSSPSLESPDRGFVADDFYYVVKELLMTERTYKKDLEVVAVWFQDAISPVLTVPHYSTELLFQALVPIYEFHCRLLNELEQRVSSWECSNSVDRNIGDLMLRNMNVLQLYRLYLDQHEEIVSQMDIALRRLPDFKRTVEDFEAQKICYLPLNAFLLKPIQRLYHYQFTFARLLNCYPADHCDAKDSKACFALINGVLLPYKDKLKDIANRLKLMDLQNGISGIDGLNQKRRVYIREGCLQKFSRKGLQQRMFFLFSDALMYASRASTSAAQFKVHGQLPIAHMIVKETDPDVSTTPFSFTVAVDNRSLMLVASSQEEKDKWIEDLKIASLHADTAGDTEVSRNLYPSLKSNSSAEMPESQLDVADKPSISQHRGNTTMHVCWHRMTSVGARDHYVSLQNQLSGFLLRKFKNSNGWQKLWVVFTNFCLYFYKSYEDDVPLATLPLLGYSVSNPDNGDEVGKDCVFKLLFRNHVYFFRADSRYTYERWLDVIGSVTSTARITRMFSRMDSSAQSPTAVLSAQQNEF